MRILTLILFVIQSFFCSNAFAARAVGTASVEIVRSGIEFVETTDIPEQFLNRPGADSVTYMIGIDIASGLPVGEIFISSIDSNSAQIFLSESINTASGVSLSRIYATLNGRRIPRSGLNEPIGSGSTLRFGAGVDIASNAAPEINQPLIDIEVSFE